VTPFIGTYASWGDVLAPPPTPRNRIGWSEVAGARCTAYEVEITDLTAATTTTREVRPFTSPPGGFIFAGDRPPRELRFGAAPFAERDATHYLTLPDGHEFTFRVRAVEREPAPPQFFNPLGICRGGGEVGPPEPGPWSPPSTPARYDGTAPRVEAVIAGGARATSRTLVPVRATTLVDPDPPGRPGAASGVVEVRVDDVPRTRISGDTYPVRLAGPDGVKRVLVTARDAVGQIGGATDEIILDRRPPRVVVRRAATRVPVGAVATFDASGTVDPAAGDGSSAGIPSDGYRWRFGDGLPGGITPVATHVFRRPGVYCGEFTARDGAGNVARQAVVTRVGPRARVLGAVRTTRAGRHLRVDVCVGRRAAVVVAVSTARGTAGTRRVTGGPGVVRVLMPRPASRATVRVAAGPDRRVLARR
jgi:hypothetical protein